MKYTRKLVSTMRMAESILGEEVYMILGKKSIDIIDNFYNQDIKSANDDILRVMITVKKAIYEAICQEHDISSKNVIKLKDKGQTILHLKNNYNLEDEDVVWFDELVNISKLTKFRFVIKKYYADYQKL